MSQPERSLLFLGRMDGGASWLAPEVPELLEHLLVSYLFEGDLCTTDVFFWLDGPFWEAWNDPRGRHLIVELVRNGALRPMFREAARSFSENVEHCLSSSWGVRVDARERAREIDKLVGSSFQAGVWRARMARQFHNEVVRTFDALRIQADPFRDDEFKRLVVKLDIVEKAIEEATTVEVGQREMTRARLLGAFGQRALGYPHEKVQRPADLVAFAAKNRPDELMFVSTVCQLTCEAYQAAHSRVHEATPVFPSVWSFRPALNQAMRAATPVAPVDREQIVGSIDVRYPDPSVLLQVPASELIKLRDEHSGYYFDLLHLCRTGPARDRAENLKQLHLEATRYSAELTKRVRSTAEEQMFARIHILANKPAIASLLTSATAATQYGYPKAGVAILGSTFLLSVYVWNRLHRIKKRKIPIRASGDAAPGKSEAFEEEPV